MKKRLKKPPNSKLQLEGKGNAILLLSFEDFFCLQIIYANFLVKTSFRQLAFWVRIKLKAFIQLDLVDQWE